MLHLLQDSCLQCLTKREAAQLAATCRDVRPALGHWLFLRHARPRTNLRLYTLMLHELRRMGLFPLYAMLHSPLNAESVAVHRGLCSSRGAGKVRGAGSGGAEPDARVHPFR